MDLLETEMDLSDLSHPRGIDNYLVESSEYVSQ